jgi:diaminopimelate decarboxylase
MPDGPFASTLCMRKAAIHAEQPQPLLPAQLWNLADQYGTPLWVYDAATIRERIAQLKAFDTVRFAQKACSNIHILKLMREQGVKVDAVSRGESCARWRRLQPGGEPTSSSPPT